MARTYTQLEKEKSLEELKNFEIHVLERYATSDFSVSQADVARDNNITESCFVRIKEEAIINGYASRELVEAVRNKAVTKSERRIQQSGGKCILYYERLIKQREEFLVTGIPKAQIKVIAEDGKTEKIYKLDKVIAEDIANNPSSPIKDFKMKYNLESCRMVRLILKIAIVENVVSDEIMELIIKRSLDLYSDETLQDRAKKVFDEFRKERESNKNSQIK